MLPFDNTQGFATAVALVNPNTTQAATISVTLRDETGAQISTETLNVAPHAHEAFFLPDRFRSVRNRRGVGEFSSTRVPVSAMGLRFNDSGAFTSFPTLRK